MRGATVIANREMGSPLPRGVLQEGWLSDGAGDAQPRRWGRSGILAGTEGSNGRRWRF
jgi:hypothetical protein